MPSVFLSLLLVAAPAPLPNSGSATAQAPFLRGLTALHNFEYEDAGEAFREAQSLDPGFALAYWGEAMSCNQTLWLNQDLEGARAILRRLGATSEARDTKARMALEKGLLRAVEALFGEGERAARDRAYAESMERLGGAFPDDPDVRTLEALAHLGTAARSPELLRDGGEERHAHALPGSEVQKQAAAILEKVLVAHPEHLGALHYLIHAYDDPDHARLALPAARTYARLAPHSSHARHMPAHVFLQLGLWADAADSDQASFAASEAWIARKGYGVGMRDYHSLSWLNYESLQLGRFEKARATLEQIRPAVQETGAPRLKVLLSDMRARYVLESGAYHEFAGARDFATSSELFAIGVSAVRRGDEPTAGLAAAELARRARDAARSGADVPILDKELAALISLREGRGDDAVRSLREATALEAHLPPPLGLPRPLKPAAELLGEVLLELKRPAEAGVEFEHALARWPNRSRSLLGRARAAAALRDRAEAARWARLFLANWATADPGLPELAEARGLLP